MASLVWTWDSTSRRYRNTTTGRWVSHTKVAELRNVYASEQRTWADQAAARLANRDWTVRRWEDEIRARLKRVYLGEYMLGRGGRNAMTPADYGRVGNMLRDQYQFLRNFSNDVQAGQMSEAQIAARTQLYHESSIQAFERGKAAAYGDDLELPCYPADGRTVCRARCRCRWRITETKTKWRAYWMRNGKAESCKDCIFREAQYRPYTQLKAVTP